MLCAAPHIYAGAIEHRAITSLAHQTGTASLLLHHLEAALVAELETAGLAGEACADALRSILVVVTGSLVLALRDQSRFPEEYRADVLWAGSAAPVASETRAALCAAPDVDALTAATLRAVVDHYVPADRPTTRRREPTPTNRPGEIGGWPKLVVTYTTDPAKVAALLPPGLEPLEPVVTLGFYCVPVLGEPELGVSVKVAAAWQGVAGQYSLGLGIDQEAAVHISAETNGQPKFLCDIAYFRFGDRITARASHQGYTFVEFAGTVSGEASAPPRRGRRARVVDQVLAGHRRAPRAPTTSRRTSSTSPRPSSRRHVEDVDGDLVLRDSPWDPIARHLPVCRAGRGAAGHPPTDGPPRHQRRPARPRRVLAVRRRHRRQPLARPPRGTAAVMTAAGSERGRHGRNH